MWSPTRGTRPATMRENSTTAWMAQKVKRRFEIKVSVTTMDATRERATVTEALGDKREPDRCVNRFRRFDRRH